MAFQNCLRGSILTIDLDAIADNYRILRETANPTKVAAVVKANAYGLGANKIAPLLQNSGCNIFFVATLDEAVQLRSILPHAEIHVFNGILPGWPKVMIEHRLRPVLNSLEQINLWHKHAQNMQTTLVADLHIDTGMSRLGLPPNEVEKFLQTPLYSNTIKLDLVLSHLSNADNSDHQMNLEQLNKFQAITKLFKSKRFSLAASSGIFLGTNYHFELVRPGIALYGGNPLPGKPNPMAQVIRLRAKILQVRSVDTPQVVGYGATYKVPGKMRIATVAIGYGDGYLRSLSNTGKAWIETYEIQVVGRISMDLTTVDVTSVPTHLTQVGAFVDFIGPSQTIDQIALSAGTIDYEFLTRLGQRFHREYIGGH